MTDKEVLSKVKKYNKLFETQSVFPVFPNKINLHQNKGWDLKTNVYNILKQYSKKVYINCIICSTGKKFVKSKVDFITVIKGKAFFVSTYDWFGKISLSEEKEFINFESYGENDENIYKRRDPRIYLAYHCNEALKLYSKRYIDKEKYIRRMVVFGDGVQFPQEMVNSKLGMVTLEQFTDFIKEEAKCKTVKPSRFDKFINIPELHYGYSERFDNWTSLEFKDNNFNGIPFTEIDCIVRDKENDGCFYVLHSDGEITYEAVDARKIYLSSGFKVLGLKYDYIKINKNLASLGIEKFKVEGE